MAMLPTDARVRAAINAGFVASGAAPRVDELAGRVEITRDEVFDSLRRLEAQGSLTLRPGTLDLWTAPPFSATPTLFRVECGEAHYWAGCAWCALGICAITGGGTIRSSIGGEDENVQLVVGADGPVVERPLWVHFAVPALRWAESLGYACNTILLFNSPDDVDDWSERHRLPRGVVVPLEQTWRLAVAWFGAALKPETHLRHRTDLEAVFRGVGLEDPFFAMRPVPKRSNQL